MQERPLGDIIGANIKRLRQINQIASQRDLADRARLSQPTISAYEAGKKLPSAAALSALCNVLRCTADELLGREPPREAS